MIQTRTFSAAFFKALPNYTQYRALADRLIAENKTTGNNQSEEYLQYTRLNIKRMERIEKTMELLPEVKEALPRIKQKQIWVIIGEAWCGDCAQNMPYLAAMANASNGQIDLRVALRDDNPEFMDAHLTNGARSVPKLIALDTQTLAELFEWGSRPAAAQEILKQYKANKDTMTHDDFEKQLHTWYAQNKGADIQRELIKLATSI